MSAAPEPMRGLGYRYPDDYKRRVLEAMLPDERERTRADLEEGSVNVSWCIADAIRRRDPAKNYDESSGSDERHEILAGLLDEFWEYRREKYRREGGDDPFGHMAPLADVPDRLLEAGLTPREVNAYIERVAFCGREKSLLRSIADIAHASHEPKKRRAKDVIRDLQATLARIRRAAEILAAP